MKINISKNIIELKNVSARYDIKPILHNIDINIENNQIVAVLGPNGSGKSTILKTIFGLTKITEGEVLLHDGKIIPDYRQLIKSGIVFVSQGKRVFGELSVEENLELGGFFLDDNKEIKRRVQEIYDIFPILKEKRKEKAGKLSGGQQQMVAIGRGLVGEPKLLMLDEPTLGLSPKVVKEIFAIIKEIKEKKGISIIVVEHNLKSILPITDKVYVINHGKIAWAGIAEDLEKQNILEKVWVGKEDKK